MTTVVNPGRRIARLANPRTSRESPGTSRLNALIESREDVLLRGVDVFVTMWRRAADEFCAEKRHHSHGEEIGCEDRQRHAKRKGGKNVLVTPVKNVTGKKTMAVVNVAASTAIDTSLPPFSAAL